MDYRLLETASSSLYKTPDNASALEKGNQKSEEVVYVGAAQSQVTTLQKLAIDTLDISWPNWRNYEKPECCIIPPIFSYTNPEKSDQDCLDEKNKLRHSEWAEHVVYKAISAFSQKNLPSPILMVHSFDLDRIKNHLPYIFPNVQISQSDPFLREYDFVLIGPKIGLVVIEVKSSEFSGPSDFKPGTRLPKDYSDGIKQLQYFAENCLNFLQECTGIKWPEESSVRRILFLPNLERARHEKWHRSLKSQKTETPRAGTFDNSDSHTIKWYKEDLDKITWKTWIRKHGEEPELLNTISRLLDSEPEHRIPKDTFEAYASIIAALGSVIVFKNQSNTKLDLVKLFEGKSLIREAEKIEAQDPGGHLKKGKEKVEKLKHFSKVILPTRQQLEALKAPNRQFIFGHAGTGKTIVLQEKALQLLGNGMKALVLAPQGYISNYKELFDSNSQHGYKVQSWEAMREDFKSTAEKIFLESCSIEADPVKAVYEHLKRGKDENSEQWRDLETHLDLWIADFDAVLIDDAMDRVRGIFDYRSSLALALTIMAYSELKYLDQTLWITLDPHSPYYDLANTGYNFFTWILGVLGHLSERSSDQKWTCSVLNRVMRSSENIFRMVYQENVEAIPGLTMKSHIGHKVVGPEVTQILDYYDGNPAETLWKGIKLELDRLLAQEIPLSYISIVVGGSIRDIRSRMEFLIEQLRGCGIPFIRKRNSDSDSSQQDGNGCSVGEALSINYWDEVSSLEWPIVIYAAAHHDCFDQANRDWLQRYRGCTRATTKLVEIIIVYRPVELSQKSVEKQNRVDISSATMVPLRKYCTRNCPGHE